MNVYSSTALQQQRAETAWHLRGNQQEGSVTTVSLCRSQKHQSHLRMSKTQMTLQVNLDLCLCACVHSFVWQVCAYVCVHLCVLIHDYLCVCAHEHEFACGYMSAHAHMCDYVCSFMSTCVCVQCMYLPISNSVKEHTSQFHM